MIETFPTPAEDLLESLCWAVKELGWLSDSLAEIRRDIDYALDDVATARLAARRGFADGDVLETIDTLYWLTGESLDQIRHLATVLGPLLEPAHSPGIRYGVKHGVYPFAPLDPRKCGTTAGYQQHRRRGEDACQPCSAAMSAYNHLATLRRQRAPLYAIAS